MIRRFAAASLLWALAACSSSATGVPLGAAPKAVPATVALQPDHGASSLPGSILPCGWPSADASEGDDDGGRGGTVSLSASCAISISSEHAALKEAVSLNAGTIPGLHPSDLVRAYGFPTNAAGMTVAIVDAYDDPRAESDLGVFRAKYHLPSCSAANGCFTKVNQRGESGRYPRRNAAWANEVALDVDMVSAICPRCPILLVEADSARIDDLGTAVDEAVALGARAVSNSYYAREWKGETAQDVHYNHPGVAITVSSGDQLQAHVGDDAAFAQPSLTTPPYYPAASPYVTSVGATALVPAGVSWTEFPWRYSGDGCSRFEPRPSFQRALCATRSSVDIAVVGDPRTGVSIYSSESGGWVVAGGTSVGAAIVAAAYALSGNPQGPGYSYAHDEAFQPVEGRFDLTTGLGSPRGIGGL